MDFVRVEIATALKRNIRVIPVLVDGASMPRFNDLPDDLKLLARRNAVEVSHNRFNADFGRLVTAIEKVLEKADAERKQREETPRPTPTTQDEAEAAIAHGNTAYDKKDYDKAISEYNEAIRLDPSLTNAYTYRGLTYWCKKENDKAISDHNEAIRLDPKCAPAYTYRGLAYYESQGKLDMAEVDFAKADELKKTGQ